MPAFDPQGGAAPSPPDGREWYKITPQPGGSNGSGSHPSIPSIDQILGQDPFYSQTAALLKAMGLDDKSLAAYKINRLKQYFGSANDPMSVMGRLYLAFQDRGRNIVNTLAGHGMIFSGETGWQQNRNALAYQQGQYDANYSLQNQVDAINEAISQAERQRQFQLLQAQADAVARYIQDNMQGGS